MTEQVIPQQRADEIDLRELFTAIWQGKWVIIAATFVAAIMSVFYALSLPDIYKSEVLLAPVTEDVGAKISGQLGGLAALAGVNLGGSAGVNKTTLALEIMQSRVFLAKFIEKYNLLPALFAFKAWDPVKNEIIIDSKLYDINTNQWIAEKPSLQQAYNTFLGILTISKDKSSGLIRVSIEHQSPNVAQAWLNELVKEINLEMRQRDAAEARKSINYLKKQIDETGITDIRITLYSLIEEQSKALMFTSVREEYAFQTVDPAVVPERKVKPKRSTIVAGVTMLAGLLSVFIIILISLFRKKAEK